MGDLFSSFSSTVSTLSAPRSAPAPSSGGALNSFFGTPKTEKTTTVKDASGTGFWGNVMGIFKSEKQVHVQSHGDKKATVTVKDTTGASAFQLGMGHAPEQRFKATQVGSQVIVEATANASDGAWNQVLGTTQKGWY